MGIILSGVFMTDILEFQQLMICEPHGNTEVLVVKIQQNFLIGFISGYSPGSNWVKLKERSGDYGYTFQNLKKTITI